MEAVHPAAAVQAAARAGFPMVRRMPDTRTSRWRLRAKLMRWVAAKLT